MLINIGVHYYHCRVYRLIGRDRYSAPTDKLLKEQEYAVGKFRTIEADPSAPYRVSYPVDARVQGVASARDLAQRKRAPDSNRL